MKIKKIKLEIIFTLTSGEDALRSVMFRWLYCGRRRVNITVIIRRRERESIAHGSCLFHECTLEILREESLYIHSIFIPTGRCLSGRREGRDVRAVNTPAGRILIFHNTVRIHSRQYHGAASCPLPLLQSPLTSRGNRQRRKGENPRQELPSLPLPPPRRLFNSTTRTRSARRRHLEGEETCYGGLP